MTIKYQKGSIHNTVRGEIEILEYIPGKRTNGKKIHPRVIIKFLKTGTVSLY